MLSLTRKTDYALVALAYLAQRRALGEPPVSARRIAEEFNLPLPLLMNILKELHQAKILTSTRGQSGGYTLTADADQIPLTDIIDVTEGVISLTPCCGRQPGLDAASSPPDHVDSHDESQSCGMQHSCTIRLPIKRLNDRIRQLLETVTLADLVESRVDVPLANVGRELAAAAQAAIDVHA